MCECGNLLHMLLNAVPVSQHTETEYVSGSQKKQTSHIVSVLRFGYG